MANPERKELCRWSLLAYLETYHRAKFSIAWSDDHLTAIDRLETIILSGGWFAYAMARGSGKTTIVVCAVEWAVSYGHRRYIVPIGATAPHAEAILETIKTDFESNPDIAADFPEICYPIAKLDGINNRAPGQMLDGHRTRIRWTGKRVVLPTVRDANGQLFPSSGVIIQAAGLLGALRGMQYTTTTGETRRPDCTILDDPQTDESARRPAQTATRKNIIDKAVLGLAGPGQRIAAMMPCTVIQEGDLADQLLDRETNPEWRGQKTQLLRSMPKNLALWAKYREIRQDSLREFEDIRLATEFYRANQAAMDEGCIPSWPERFEQGQISAIQYGMDIWAKNEGTFWAEYQNAPLAEEQGDIETLRAADIMARVNGLRRGQVPEWATSITAFIDVQQDVLPWMVVAWNTDLTGAIIDYGTWPEQVKRYWTLRDLDRTLRQTTEMPTVEEALRIGLDQLTERLLGRDFDGRRVGWLGVDANWQLSTQMVYQLARRKSLVHAYHGRFVGAAGLPMAEWRTEPGTKKGHFWRIVKDRNNGPQVQADINAWKSLVAKRCRVEKGAPGGIEIFGDNPRQHELLADQLSAEYGVRVTGRGRRVDEWKNRPGRDNHYWDCLVGCAVGASIGGGTIPGQAVAPQRKVVSLSEQQRQRRQQGRQ